MRKTAVAAGLCRRLILEFGFGWGALVASLLLVAAPVAAQDPASFYRGKTLRIM